MEDYGPLIMFMPLGAVVSGIAATARRWNPKIDGWYVVLFLALASLALVLIVATPSFENGTVKASKILIDTLGTTLMGFVLFNGLRAATGGTGSAGSGQP